MSAVNGKGFGLFTSTIMLKVVMALTGAGMALFVLGHMAGHLQMFLGREAYNAYAHFMQHGLGELIWLLRIGLLGLVGAHIAAAVELTKRNTAARSRGYSAPLQSRRTTTPAKLMVLSGVVIALLALKCLKPPDSHQPRTRMPVFSRMSSAIASPNGPSSTAHATSSEGKR